MGELEMRLEKKPRNILFIKVSLDCEKKSLHSMKDIDLTVEST